MAKREVLDKLNQRVIKCKKCPRLARYIQKVAREKVRRFKNEKYWGRPLPGYGDPKAKLLLVGLAPAAHGGNRTGRMFTGDSSGEWVAKVLYEHGFANKPTSQNSNDGFALNNTYITAALRCAPPKNKPTSEELQNCSQYLSTELMTLENVRVIICLGKIAFDSCCKMLGIKRPRFAHGKSFTHDKRTIISTYHPSRQNTQTGRLTWKQWSDIFSKAKKILDKKK